MGRKMVNGELSTPARRLFGGFNGCRLPVVGYRLSVY